MTALIVGGWLLFLAVNGESRATKLVSNFGLVSAPFVASWACAAAARRSTAGARRSWWLFAATCLSWGLGQTIWTIYETLGRSVPFPSLADVGYLTAVPLAVAALVALPSGSRSSPGRTRLVVDGLVTASSLLIVSWALVLGPLFRAGSGQLFPQVISLAYPVGDVVTITMALSVLCYSRKGGALSLPTLTLISAALVSLAVADSGFTYLTTTGLYFSGHPIDGGWFLGFALLFLAARTHNCSATENTSREVPRRAAAATPYVALLAALVTAGTVQVLNGSIGAFIVWNLAFTVLLLLVRQYLSILENHSLARTLEERVRVRTAEVVKNEERFRSLVQNSSDVVSILEPDGVIRYQSPSLEKVFGYAPDLLTSSSFYDLVQPDELQAFNDALAVAQSRPGGSSLVEVGLLHRDGRWRRAETAVTNLIDDPSVCGIVLNTRDISERKQLEELLLHQAFHDPLTGLANAALFRDRLQHALSQRRHRHRNLALLFCDLDGFKRVNDSLGHSSGDLLLVAVGERLRAVVRPADTVARLGGDEFAILLDEVMFESEANIVAERLTEALRAPIVIDKRELFVSVSIGIAVADPDSDTVDSLLRNADLAMYRAKSQGLGGYERFEATMRTAAVDKVGLETDLHHALARHELCLHYQPVVDLTSGHVMGVEALARWEHPTRGAVPPGDFIPLAEWSSLIVDIGRWVLYEACQQMKQWEASWPGQAAGTVAVNLSGRQLLHPGLVADVAAALARSGLDPSRLVLEMTESVLLAHDEETVQTMRLLKGLGVRLAIDDFGTGYSSLSYLHDFPFDMLKIDRSFVGRLSNENPQFSLASSIVRIGQALGLELVAEGIEEQDQLDALRAINCQMGQGYFFAKPIPAEQLLGKLQDIRPISLPTSMESLN